MADLSTRTKRRNLPRSKDRTWVRIARGRSLGYRRSGSGPGTWAVRVFVGRDAPGSPYRKRSLGYADDQAEVDDSDEVLSYSDALKQALSWEPGTDQDEDDQDQRRPLTVRRALMRYLEWYEVYRRSPERIRYNFKAHVLPELGDIKVESLTTARLRRWHQELAKKPARLRGGKSREAQTEDEKRARKVTANRLLKDVKAALNRAVADGLVQSGEAWRRVRPFGGVEKARAEYLDHDQLHALLSACAPAFRDLVRAAVYTGARYSELAALRAQDFRPEASAVHFPKTKNGIPRYVYLADEGMEFFRRLSADRKPNDLLLVKSDGSPWGRSHQTRVMRDSCEAAGIEPLGFHQLRHTYASLYLMSGGSLVSLAKQLGHTTTRMVEKHYGHLADSWRAEEARKHAPSLGLEPATGAGTESEVESARCQPANRPPNRKSSASSPRSPRTPRWKTSSTTSMCSSTSSAAAGTSTRAES